jgi:glutathione S-transferase
LPAIQRSLDRCAAHFQLLDETLADQQFLVGDTVTLADIPIGTQLYRYFNLEIERPHIPHVEAWYQRLQERPSYQKNVMVPFKDQHGRLEY